MMGLPALISAMPEAKLKTIDQHGQRFFKLLGLVISLVFFGDLIAFNLPASVICKGTQSYAADEQSQPQTYYPILGDSSGPPSNADLKLSTEYESDFCKSDYYVCSARPVKCSESALADVYRDRVSLLSFTRPDFSQSLATLFSGLFTIIWGCVWNVGLFLWFAFSVPALLSFASFFIISLVLEDVWSAYVGQPLAALKAAQKTLSQQKPPALTQIGKEDAQGSGGIASAAKAAAALNRRDDLNYADQMKFED